MTHNAVRTLMTRDVISCTPETNLAEAVIAMRRRNVGALPVVDERRRPVGMITDRDIALAAAERHQPLDELQVGEAMSEGVYTCGAGDTLNAAERVMCKHQVRRVPVVDEDGVLCGIITVQDLARAAQQVRGSSELDRQEIAAILRAISEPTEAPRT